MVLHVERDVRETRVNLPAIDFHGTKVDWTFITRIFFFLYTSVPLNSSSNHAKRSEWEVESNRLGKFEEKTKEETDISRTHTRTHVEARDKAQDKDNLSSSVEEA